MSSTHRPTLDERVMQFNMLQLPGQPMAMHMGTAYLVSDLHKRVKELEGALRQAMMCGLPPHDVSGQRMWEEARAALSGEQTDEREK